MADKFDRIRTGDQFFKHKGLVKMSVYQRDYVWDIYRRAAKRKGWSLRRYLTWYLKKCSPK